MAGALMLDAVTLEIPPAAAGDYQNDLNRFIFIGKSLQNFDKNRYQVLDTSQSLILYADKDAKIWEDKGK